MIGNTRLVEYGIQTERSDLRAHVCVCARRIYVYPTACGLQTINAGDYEARPVYTGNIKTAIGYAVPWQNIARCVSVRIPDWLFTEMAFSETDSTTEKGRKAARVCARMIELGAFPLPTPPNVVSDTPTQIEGTDVIVTISARIQVKMDYRGGSKEHGGTGNLFLQTAECNPYRAA